MLVTVSPFTNDELAPPYTLFPIIPPAISTIAFEVVELSCPVFAAFPLPKTCFPTVVVPSKIICEFS